MRSMDDGNAVPNQPKRKKIKIDEAMDVKPRALIKLDFDEQYFSINSFERILRNNQSLKSLLINNFQPNDMKYWDCLALVARHLNELKEFALMISYDEWMEDPIDPEPTEINQISNFFEHLKSLELSIEWSMIPQFQMIDMANNKIEHLGLHVFQNDCDYFESFGNILDHVEPLLKQVQNFHRLSFRMHRTSDVACAAVLKLLQKFASLETITLIFEKYDDVCMEKLINIQFFDDFIKTITDAEKNAEIIVKCRDRNIGVLCKSGIQWQNKWLYWPGCKDNSSKVHSLDLAVPKLKLNDQQHGEEAANNAGKRNLLDSIFDYLDVHSLYSFSETNEQNKQLVKGYVKKHSENQGMFTATDEFFAYDPLDGEVRIDLLDVLDTLELTYPVSNLKIHKSTM